MKKLVAYFSASGVTAGKAAQLAKAVGADIYEITPAVKYTTGDLNWMDKKSRSTHEMNDPASRPELADVKKDFSAYDMIYLGFPIWWYTAPKIINSFVESNDLRGRQIVLFATSGGSSIERAVKDLKKQYPELNITGGKTLNGSVSGDIA